ncbi:MAG TPA: pyrroline-5-carboxylate reductase [Gammaproteobacteria bacterium]|nr:pyrroline-5-carboxylate reductase [Gammaproteobacteria bacterium]
MAQSLIGGLIDQGHTTTALHVCDIDTERLQHLKTRFGVMGSTDKDTSLRNAELVILAVKPDVIRPVIDDIAHIVRHTGALIVSVAAGVREPDMQRWLGAEHPVVRCMPNTPALYGAGASVLYANAHVSDTHRQLAEAILNSAGTTEWVDDEALLDAVTALSGSGPAYMFYLVECMALAGQKLGLDADMAQRLAQQTAVGAATMLARDSQSPAQLRANVTSKGGTTQAALESFQAAQLDDIVYKGMESAYNRSRELGKQLGDN